VIYPPGCGAGGRRRFDRRTGEQRPIIPIANSRLAIEVSVARHPGALLAGTKHSSRTHADCPTRCTGGFR
jgi:hypothetical protein